MTDVFFHLNVPDVESYACRLLRKAYLKGARVAVQVEGALAQALDRRLWLMAQSDFVPHATGSSAQRVRERSPILLGAGDAEGLATVLVNLTTRLPGAPERFERVIEVVGAGESDIVQARERWKAYRDSGLAPQAFDVSSGGEG
jgi:DNA polymerase III subunit chi